MACMVFRSRLRFLLDAGIFLLALGPRGGWALAAALPDGGYYPVSSRPPPAQAAPLLLFEKIFETEVPGLPSGGPLEMRADGRSLIVRTNAGDFEIDLRTASTPASAPPAPRRVASAAALPP